MYCIHKDTQVLQNLKNSLSILLKILRLLGNLKHGGKDQAVGRRVPYNSTCTDTQPNGHELEDGETWR